MMVQAQTLIHRNVERAREAKNPTVIMQVPAGWIVLGDSQFLKGYSLLLPDPVVPDLNALNGEARREFLWTMSVLGDALLEVTDAYRINYEILGNTDPALHAHVIPRYRSEPDQFRGWPMFSYPKAQRDSVPFDLHRDKPLMNAIATQVRRRLAAK